MSPFNKFVSYLLNYTNVVPHDTCGTHNTVLNTFVNATTTMQISITQTPLSVCDSEEFRNVAKGTNSYERYRKIAISL